MSGWLPIDTAPKNGLSDVFCNGRRYAGCHYDRFCDEYRHITACGVLIRLKGATHWMAAPDPPSIQTKKHEGPCWRQASSDCGC